MTIENAGEGEKKREKTESSQSDGAKAGTGAPPEATERRPQKARRSRPSRGKTTLEPSLADLARQVGANKPAPDRSALEVHYARSLRFRRLITAFLEDNVGSRWEDLTELHARAANEAGCALQTAARWVYQLTRVEMPYRLVEGLDYWILERRG